jgi:hypothetical protein
MQCIFFLGDAMHLESLEGEKIRLTDWVLSF